MALEAEQTVVGYQCHRIHRQVRSRKHRAPSGSQLLQRMAASQIGYQETRESYVMQKGITWACVCSREFPELQVATESLSII